MATESGTSRGSAAVDVSGKDSGVLQASLLYDKISASTMAKLAGVPKRQRGVTPSSGTKPLPYTITVVTPPNGPLFGYIWRTPYGLKYVSSVSSVKE